MGERTEESQEFCIKRQMPVIAHCAPSTLTDLPELGSCRLNLHCATAQFLPPAPPASKDQEPEHQTQPERSSCTTLCRWQHYHSLSFLSPYPSLPSIRIPVALRSTSLFFTFVDALPIALRTPHILRSPYLRLVGWLAGCPPSLFARPAPASRQPTTALQHGQGCLSCAL